MHITKSFTLQNIALSSVVSSVLITAPSVYGQPPVVPIASVFSIGVDSPIDSISSVENKIWAVANPGDICKPSDMLAPKPALQLILLGASSIVSFGIALAAGFATFIPAINTTAADFSLVAMTVAVTLAYFSARLAQASR